MVLRGPCCPSPLVVTVALVPWFRVVMVSAGPSYRSGGPGLATAGALETSGAIVGVVSVLGTVAERPAGRPGALLWCFLWAPGP